MADSERDFETWQNEESGKLEAFIAAHAAEIEAIASEMNDRNISDDAFDELVLTAAENAGGSEFAEDASRWASDAINNQGFSRQIAFIMQEHGKPEGLAAIEAAAREAAQTPQLR